MTVIVGRYWREEKSLEPPRLSQVDSVLAYLATLGIQGEALGGAPAAAPSSSSVHNRD